jgi:hypothetical protein
MAFGRKAGGRKKGSLNKATVARQQAMRDAEARLAANMPEGFAGDAHALLVAIYTDTALPIELRLDAAKAAVRFERPVLAATTLTNKDPFDDLTTDELRRLRP